VRWATHGGRSGSLARPQFAWQTSIVRTRWKVAGAVVVVAVLATLVYLLPVRRWLTAFVDWMRYAGALGVLGFALLFVVCGFFVLPIVELLIGAGLVYGVFWGSVIATLASVLGALVSDLVVRSPARRWLEPRLMKHAKLDALDRGIGEKSFTFALMLRLAPAPYGLLNYGIASARVPLWQNLVTTAIGMLPLNIVNAWIGTTLLRAKDGWANKVAMFGAIAMAIIAVVFLTWIAKRALAQVAGRQAPARADDTRHSRAEGTLAASHQT